MSDVQQPEEPATGPIAPVPSPVPPRAPPKFDLGMVAALSCLPVTVLGLFAPNMDWCPRGDPGIRHGHRHPFVCDGVPVASLATRRCTGLWLLPTIAVVVACVEAGFVGRIRPEELFCPGFGSALAGLVAGYVTTKQIEGLIVLGSMLRHRLRGRAPRRESFDSFNERLDEVSTPLDMPPLFGLPRRFEHPRTADRDNLGRRAPGQFAGVRRQSERLLHGDDLPGRDTRLAGTRSGAADRGVDVGL